MNRRQVSELLEKIQAYRQSFMITETLIKEWSRILEPYDPIDVDYRLDQFLKDGENFGRYPDVYNLTKNLKTLAEKSNEGTCNVICPHCKTAIDIFKFENHYHRCSSAKYLCDMSVKYFQKEISIKELVEMSDKEFDDYYYKFCNQVFDQVERGLQKHTLKNVILTGAGMEPELNLEIISKELVS